MTSNPLIEISLESKTRLFAGIDVGAEELALVVRKNGKSFEPQKYTIPVLITPG